MVVAWVADAKIVLAGAPSNSSIERKSQVSESMIKCLESRETPEYKIPTVTKAIEKNTKDRVPHRSCSVAFLTSRRLRLIQRVFHHLQLSGDRNP